MTITLTREEAQQLIDELWKSFNEEATKPNLLSAIETLRAKLSEPEQIVPLAEYKKLQKLVTSQGIRLMEYESQPESEPVAWKVWTVHNHIFFSIGVQTFQINDVLEHQPEVIAKEFSEWLATQLRHALTLLSTTPPQRKPEPKPVAWLNKLGNGAWIADVLKCEGDEPSEPLYTASPQRDETSAKAAEWVGLTDKEITELWEAPGDSGSEFARAIEQVLKEKNNG